MESFSVKPKTIADKNSKGKKQKAEGKRQKAKGRRQKAKGKWQKAKGKKQKAKADTNYTNSTNSKGKRQKAKGKKQKRTRIQKAKGKRQKAKGKKQKQITLAVRNSYPPERGIIGGSFHTRKSTIKTQLTHGVYCLYET